MNQLPPSRSIDDAVFTFLDVETTGLSPRTSRICEVALIGFQGASRVSQFSSLVNPGLPIPPETTRIHGITDEMVRNSPAFPALAPRLLALLEGTVVVAHNAEFDLSFVQMEFSRVGLKLPKLDVIDTVHIARHLGGFSNNRLGTIARAGYFQRELAPGPERRGDDAQDLRAFHGYSRRKARYGWQMF